MHEFMHALGINHEQTRPDRDDYIFVDKSVVEFPVSIQGKNDINIILIKTIFFRNSLYMI